MGSGHFLVEASRLSLPAYRRLGCCPNRPKLPPNESDLAYWRRRVAQTCIYGVDVNPLAVELAKLSLWLTTVAKGKPLSFLDHHLRCGNSLIGAGWPTCPWRAADLPPRNPSVKKRQKAEQRARAAGQLSMLDDSAFAGSMRTAAGFMGQIETVAQRYPGRGAEAEGLYRQVIEEVTARARQLADVWTARLFGLPDLDDTLWQRPDPLCTARRLRVASV